MKAIKMKNNSKLFRTLGTLIFIPGILVGMVMFVFMNWANFEAYFYFGYSAPADKALTSMRCPLMLTTPETGEVTIKITNDSDRDLSPLIRTETSYYGAAKLESVNYPLKAGETRRLSWKVNSDAMVFGHLVMARIFVYRAFTLSSYTKTCGTVMVNVPGLSGIQLFSITLGFILLCMGGGWGLWLAGNRPLHALKAEGRIAIRAMVLFTAVVLVGLIAGITGMWGIGLLCTVASVLLIIVVGGYYLQKP
jgi:hypothetical protein